MDLSGLPPLADHGAWAIGLALGIPACAKLVALAIAVRGADPKDRPTIIKAVAELFRRQK